MGMRLFATAKVVGQEGVVALASCIRIAEV